MAHFAIEHHETKEAQMIKSIASIFITIAGILSLYIMNDSFPGVISTWFRIVISLPSLILFAIAIYVLIVPADVEL